MVKRLHLAGSSEIGTHIKSLEELRWLLCYVILFCAGQYY
jgi:hypothetical protein